jgi:hypothetical protein
MGHVILECGTCEFSEDQIQYGDWMLAPMETWHPETPRVRGGFSRELGTNAGGRGAMGGRGSRMGGRHAGRAISRNLGPQCKMLNRALISRIII